MAVRVEVKRHNRCCFCGACCHVVGCIKAAPLCDALRQYTTKEGGSVKNYTLTITVETPENLFVQQLVSVRGSWADVVRCAEEKYAHACDLTAECTTLR